MPESFSGFIFTLLTFSYSELLQTESKKIKSDISDNINRALQYKRLVMTLNLELQHY